MGTEDVCNTGLVLGLNIDGVEEKRLQTKKYRQQNLVCFEFDQLPQMEGLETCLTLSLVPKKINKNKAGDQVQVVHQSSSQSTVSSFSNPNHDITSSNRERDDFEVERLSLRVSDEEDEGSAKKKLRLTKEQSALLEDNFKEHRTLNPVCLIISRGYRLHHLIYFHSFCFSPWNHESISTIDLMNLLDS